MVKSDAIFKMWELGGHGIGGGDMAGESAMEGGCGELDVV
jgi:hypothetical protein